MLIGYLFDNRLLRFKEDSTFLILCANAAICEDFWLPWLSGPETKKSEFFPSLFFTLWSISLIWSNKQLMKNNKKSNIFLQNFLCKTKAYLQRANFLDLIDKQAELRHRHHKSPCQPHLRRKLLLNEVWNVRFDRINRLKLYNWDCKQLVGVTTRVSSKTGQDLETLKVLGLSGPLVPGLENWKSPGKWKH